MRVQRCYCPECEGPAVIKKTVRQHRHLTQRYMACDNVECGHTWVDNCIFSHTLSPSALTQDKIVKNLIDLLRPEQRQMALELLSNAV